MISAISYRSLAVVEVQSQGEVAIETLSVTPDTCDLSGAWLIPIDRLKEVSQIIDGRLLLIIGDRTNAEEIFANNLSLEVTIHDFIEEADRDARTAIVAFEKYVFQSDEAYSKYMSINPTERKLLPKMVKKKPIHPEFYNWPQEMDLTRPNEFLVSQRRISEMSGTDPKLQNVLTMAKLIKFLIDMWRRDEFERKNRLYVNDSEAVVSILPNCWLAKFVR